MQVTIRINKAVESTSTKSDDLWLYNTDNQDLDNMLLSTNHSDGVRLLFDGSKCYMEENGRFLPLKKQKIALNQYFFLELDAQEQTLEQKKIDHLSSVTHTINTTPKPKNSQINTNERAASNQDKNPNDPLAFLLNSSLLINQVRNYPHALTDQS